MDKKINIGILGARMGLAHALGVISMKNANLSAIMDPNQEILDKARQETGLLPENCYREDRPLMEREDIDVIIVSSPDGCHMEQTIAALNAGKHVLCEKPMAINTGQCIQMINASEKTGKKLMVGQLVRYAPAFRKAKKLIDEGYIGELFYVESEYAHDYSLLEGVGGWRKDPKNLRHPALGGGCHAVDLLRYFAGNPTTVSALSNRKVLTDWPVDDATIGILQFPNDVIGKVFVSVGCKRNYTMRTLFYGTKGTIVADNRSQHLTIYQEKITDGPSIFGEGSHHSFGIPLPVPVKADKASKTAVEIEEFVDCILEEKPVRTDGIEGASTVAVCMAMVESAANNGRQVEVDYNF